MRFTRLCITALTALLIIVAACVPGPTRVVTAAPAQGGGVTVCAGAHHVAFDARPSRLDSLQHLGGSWPTKVAIPLTVVLEWQTQGIDDFLWWQQALLDAARFLSYSTKGQATIGHVDLFDNACQWASADVQVFAHNTGFPDATVGGIRPQTVMSPKVKLNASLRSGLVPSVSSGGSFPSTSSRPFLSGSIHLGRSWSKRGPLHGRWTKRAGFRTIVHELGHYAFYLYDEYYGYDDSNASNPRQSTSCKGPGHRASPPESSSLMYWEYTRDSFWYWKPGTSLGDCKWTQQWRVYGQSDWSVISKHYPSLHYMSLTGGPPGPLWCPSCGAPTVDRWHLSIVNSKHSVLPVADGYLVKSGGARVLHEGVLCPAHPCLPGQWPGQLEVVGGGKADIVRLTGADRRTGHIWQASLMLNGPRGNAVLWRHHPHWYKKLASIPSVDAAPVLTGHFLTGLKLITTDPSGATPRTDERRISATLYEVGLGPENKPRHPTTILHASGTTHRGSLTLIPGCAPHPPSSTSCSPMVPYCTQGLPVLPQYRCSPILAGAVYLTPIVSKHPQQRPDRPDGPKATWELAYLSLSCNDPTDYLVGHAPGDEDGLDSADGVVNVHLATSTLALPDYCLAITAEPPGTFNRAKGLTGSYSIHGVRSNSRSLPQSVNAVVTLHYDRSLVKGSTLPIIAPLVRSKTAKKGPQLVPVWRVSKGQCTDTGSGTVSTTVRLTNLNGTYQFQVVRPSALHLPFTPHACAKPATAGKSGKRGNPRPTRLGREGI